MKYLCIPAHMYSILIRHSPSDLIIPHCWYRASDEACAIADCWWSTPAGDDATASGVLADYLFEHREELLTETGTHLTTTSPESVLDDFISELRSRFQSQFESSK